MTVIKTFDYKNDRELHEELIKEVLAAYPEKTGKKRAKHGRRLRRTAVTDKTNVGAVRRQLPYLKHKGH